MKRTYGVVAADGEIVECRSRRTAELLAKQLAQETGEADLVELDGRGPYRASDGTLVAPTHAPKRLVQTIRHG